MSQSKRKVICYRFDAYAMEHLYDENMQWTGNNFIIDTVSRCNGGGGPEIRLDWHVGYEIKSPLDKEPRYLYLNGNSAYHHAEYKVMDWTVERETFFIKFDQELCNLIKKVSKFLCGDVTVMAALIERCSSFQALPESPTQVASLVKEEKKC